MKKVGISTVHTGFNYGSSLQAFATKKILEGLNYEALHLSLKGSILKGRDVRFGKLISILIRMSLKPKHLLGRFKHYKSSITKDYPENSKNLFIEFSKDMIQPKYYSYRQLKKLAKKDDYIAFLCGSDQVWSGSALYIDPQYYLRYAPLHKRIAFAPSFGTKDVQQRNVRIISKYISEIPSISVRENSGVEIIKRFTGKDSVQIIDPTLVLDRKCWFKYLGLDVKANNNHQKYILVYFLSKPSEIAKQFIYKLKKSTGYEVLALPYNRDKEDWFDVIPFAGPKEFVELIRKAKYVLTDSFHGTAFSVNFGIQFYTFEREYGSTIKQSSRLISFLELVKLSHRFNPIADSINETIDFNVSHTILEIERKKAINYLISSLERLEA